VEFVCGAREVKDRRSLWEGGTNRQILSSHTLHFWIVEITDFCSLVLVALEMKHGVRVSVALESGAQPW
jgi:hypothetical protein